jgi:TonB-linked SusC/RagA family outer membrane protein
MRKSILIFTLILFITGQLFAQVTASGLVKDKSGEPLPGVNVIIKGTTQGTVTDGNGNYTISDVPAEGTLVFSFLGKANQEIVVGNQTKIDVIMEEDITNLDEVVVIGYGGVKRANLTGSVVDIKAEEIEDIPVSNLTTALQGRLAGVKIGQSTGKPGAATSFQIRTSSSYGEVSENPIFVIDGVIYDGIRGGQEKLDILDPSEIESISILKDASAAVYGARAAGGVVLIKTKTGEKGKTKINYSGSYGFAEAIKIPEMLSAYEHASMLNEIYDIEGTHFAWDYYAEDELEYFKTVDYNWLDGLWKSAGQNRHTLNVSGGSDKVRYFAGGSYYYETGNIDNLDVKKYSVRTNIDANITKDLVASLGLSINQRENKQPNYSEETQEGVLRDTYKQLLTTPRWVPPVIDGLPVDNDMVSWNPYGMMESGSYKSGRDNSANVIGALEYIVPFVKGLKLKVQYSYNQDNGKGKRYLQDYYIYNFPVAGTYRHIIVDTMPSTGIGRLVNNRESLQEKTEYSKGYQLNTSVSYSREFGEHDLNALLVYEQSEFESSEFSTELTGAEIRGFDYMWAFNQANILNRSGASESGNLGYIGRLNYVYANKYIVEATFRYEASQVFHPDHRWGFFPAVSAGWVLSEENFFRNNVSVINFLKLRGSAGLVGNDGVRPFQWRHSYNTNTTGAIFGSELTNAIEAKNSGVITPSLTWQKSRSFNTGLDMRILESKVSFGVDYYYRLTYDILTDRGSSIPSTAGIENMPDENWGEMYAKGLEFELGYNGNITSNLKYFIKGIFSWDKHRKVVVFQNIATEGRWDDQRDHDPSNQPGWLCLGMIRTQEDLDAILAENPEYTIDEKPPELGMLYYDDFRGENYSEGPDSVVNKWDKVILAEYTSPPYNYGISLGASWKGLSIDFTFKGEFGHKAFVSKDEQELPTATFNVFSWWADHWTMDNPNATYPRPYDYGLVKQHSNFWMRDGHTLRLTNMNISYNLPGKIASAWGIPQLRIYFTTNNLWTVISPFDYKDPNVSRAYDYPMMRTYNFGVSITL